MEVKKMTTTSTASSAARKQPTAVSRMKQDYMRLKRDPLPYITAEPLPNNILEWHYVVKGPEDSPYHGGYYHGTLLFPREFPFKPPSIYMMTPNGRFKTNTRLCLSISDFHPDTWNPTWCVGTILAGLLSFMLEKTPTLGSIESSPIEKQHYAKKSLAFNLKNQTFRELFPDICEEINKRLQSEQQEILQANAAATANANKVASDGSIIGNKTGADNNYTNGIMATGEQLANGGMGVGGFANAAVQHIGNATGQNIASNSYFNWHSIYSNLIIVISFAIFALIVNYVIKNLNQE